MLPRRDLILAALYHHAKNYDMRCVSREGVLTHYPRTLSSPDQDQQASEEHLKSILYWRRFDGRQRWNVIQLSKEEVKIAMVWVDDTRLESSEFLNPGSDLLREAEIALAHAIAAVKRMADCSTTTTHQIAGSTIETRSFAERFREEEALKQKSIFTGLYTIAKKYESMESSSDDSVGRWKGFSGELRNEVFKQCANNINERQWEPKPLVPGGEFLEDSNASELSDHIVDIFPQIINILADT
ncbi:hypothetical protein BDN70DRAFT_954803 [Pholiota conissans]|uniref:Uncharacterized protein n=1 Tax=Pholiota conissans TaxID=109636 RepID=A0A9P5YU92_9AGAR|nr:hypothetical protein BDN70DRAFT_954803 [Pholiota conissans]